MNPRTIPPALPLGPLCPVGVTGTEYHQIDWQVQVVDIVQPEETILGLALFVHQRKHQAGQLGVFAVEQSMGGEVHNAILAQLRTGRCRPAGLKVQWPSCLHPQAPLP